MCLTILILTTMQIGGRFSQNASKKYRDGVKFAGVIGNSTK